MGKLMKRILLAFAALALILVVAARAEYGDVVLNDRAETGGMRPVIFPHWFHRTVFKCRACHTELGFKMEVGGNHITMADVYRGRYCGECHNGKTAWGDRRQLRALPFGPQGHADRHSRPSSPFPCAHV